MQTRTLRQTEQGGDHVLQLTREEWAWVLDPAEIKQVFAELDPPHRLIAQLCC